MRHFGHIAPEVRQRLFHQEPCEFTADSPARTLAVALGATLYSPATRPKLAEDIVKQAGRGVVSMVLCLEDSIDDAEVAGRRGEPGPAVRATSPSAARTTELPLLFIRVRDARADPGPRRAARARPSGCCPDSYCRSSPRSGACRSWRRSTAAEAASGRRLFAMPVLESPELLHLETRAETLAGISRAVDKYRDRVLALRLGVTDFCSAYGLRRAPDMTAYDVQVVASVIADVVNVLGRADGTGFTVTGPGVGVLPASRSACSSRSCAAAPSLEDGPRSCAPR